MGNKIVLYPNLIAELARCGVTITRLAKSINISRNALYRKLDGKVAFTLKDMVAIQNFFNDEVGGAFSLDYLFKNGD